MSRQPKRPARPTEAEERRAALLALDVGAMRAWAARWLPPEHNTIAATDDYQLLLDMHAVRLRDETMPAELRMISALVLAELGDPTAQAVLNAMRNTPVT